MSQNINWLDLQWKDRKAGMPLRDYQLKKIKETVNYARTHSSFYSGLYGDMSVESLEDFERLPFTTPLDLRNRGEEMLCLPQSNISRIVTLQTSGTTGNPKRIYFTQEDQQLTVDYFAYGMRYLVSPGGCVAVLMPHERPGSIGDLLRKGLDKLGAETVFYLGPEVTCVVGDPKGTLDAVEHTNISPEKVLLSADYVSPSVSRRIEELWNCKVYEHYGMTEMGLGCAVSCHERQGYHVREYDLYLEIINPRTGEVLGEGKEGEIVFTTLNRQGMPFIRYRTGDRSKWLSPCRCGSIMRRINRVGERTVK